MPVASCVSTIGATPGTAGAWPSTGAQQARKPAGGFIDCPVDYLTLPWWVYQQGAMGVDTLRVWLGTLELVEKRCCTAPDAPVHYGPEELRRLLRAPRLAPVQEAVQRLEDLGLLAWSPQVIQFLPQAQVLQEALGQDGYQTLRAQLAPGLRWVPVPRRLLVWLAQEGQPGVIATALGVLLRCMRYKARQCVAGGRVAVPWIATVFGVAERTVQRAMQILLGCGWLARLAGRVAHERPHGRYTVINLAWQRPGAAERPRDTCTAAAAAPPPVPAAAPCHNLSPLQGAGGGNLSPMPAQALSITSENTEGCADAMVAFFQPLQEESQDPEPTERGPTGAATRDEQDVEHLPATPAAPPEELSVTEDEYAAAAARLVAQGMDPALCIRPVVVAEVQRIRAEASSGPDAAPSQTPEATAACQTPLASTVRPPAPAVCPSALRSPQAPTPCQHLSPLQRARWQHLSPMPAYMVSITSENTEGCADAMVAFFQPFQEESQDPEPARRGPAGAATREESATEPSPRVPRSFPEDEPVTDEAYTAATARRVAQGLDPALLIRPVVVAEIPRVRGEVARGRAVAPGQAIKVPGANQVMTAPAACPSAPRPPQAVTAPVVPACARTLPRTPPSLREVTLADLHDVGRLLALHQQARARGWLRGGEAEQLNVVAAAVHARRVGQAPCRLFVALLRDRRWEVITQADEDQACALLRAYRDGPLRRSTAEACAPVPEAALSDDARFVLLAEQILRQAGWRGEPFLGVKLQDPTWTRARWEHAQAELTRWRLQHVQARRRGSGLEPLGAPWADGEDTEVVFSMGRDAVREAHNPLL